MKYIFGSVTLLLIFMLSEGNGNCGNNEEYVQLKCESRNYNYYKCRTSAMTKVTSVSVRKKVSKSRCTKGYSYGMRDGYIWVDHGCRAHFHVCHSQGKGNCGSNEDYVQLYCQSKHYLYKKCYTGAMTDVTSVTMSRRISLAGCKKYYSYGMKDDYIWVKHGCRAHFDVCFEQGRVLYEVCESENKKPKNCDVRPQMDIYKLELVSKHSTSPCVSGKTYGFRGHTIWVRNGCRAKFKVYGL